MRATHIKHICVHGSECIINMNILYRGSGETKIMGSSIGFV